MKFNVGDNIKPKPLIQGFNKAVVSEINNGYYYLKIPCGMATVKVDIVDNNYQLIEQTKD